MALLRGLVPLVLLTASTFGEPVGRPPPELVGSETEIKAAFLYNFAKFTTWPTNALPQADSAIRFCVVGNDNLRDALAAAIQGKTIGGRPVELSPGWDSAAVQACHIVFVARSEPRIAEVLAGVRGLPVLTVSDADDFVATGGMVGFVRANGRIQFEINHRAAKQGGLSLSSRLLHLARRVLSSPQPAQERRE